MAAWRMPRFFEPRRSPTDDMADTEYAAGVSQPPPNGRLQVQLIGSPTIVTSEGRRWPLERRDAAMLAFVAIEGETPRLRLLEMLWPDVEPEIARNALRQRIYQLKKRCGVELLHGAERVTLGAALDVDLHHDAAPGVPLLNGCDYGDYPVFFEWLSSQRERFGNEHRALLTQQAEAAEKDGRLAQAIDVAEELIAASPLQEHAHRRLMRLHYLRGDRAAALAAFDRCERILKDELGARPGGETLALLKTIETSAATPVLAVQAIPASILRPPRMIGRANELQAISLAWGSNRGFLLLGEAGLGKTRLLLELAAGTPGAVHVQARPGDAGVPYASLARALRALIERYPAAVEAASRAELARVLPEVGEAPEGSTETQRPALQRALDAVVRAAGTQGVAALLVDDLHYADVASLEMLCTLDGEGASGVRWGFASRVVEGGAAAEALLRRLVEARGLARIALSTLDEAQIAELIDSLGVTGHEGARLAPSLMRHTGGNPLFALETVKQMTLAGTRRDELPRPATVGQLIDNRLRQLSPRATGLARAAAVAGVDFSVALAEAVTGVNALELADAWQELESAQVLRGNGFAHDLVYEAALASVPEAIARHLHQSIARWLQAHAGVPARIALHYTSAGLPALAAEHWLASARAAQAALRFVEATEAYERAALGFAEGRRVDLAFDAAYAMRMASFEIDLVDRSNAALELLERFATTPVQRARAHNERAVTRLPRGDLAGTEQSALAGLRELGGANQPTLRAELRRNLAAVYAWRNETQAALNELQATQQDVERFGSAHQKFEFWHSLAVVLDHVDQTDEAERIHRSAIEAALEVRNLPGAAQSALNLAVTLHDAGRIEDALAACERARGLLAAVEAGSHSYSSLHLNTGFILRALCDFSGALEHLTLAIEICRAQTPGWMPMVLAQRAQVFVHLGQFARAQRDLDAAVPDDKTPMTARCRWTAVRGALLHRLGQRSLDDIDALIVLQPASGRRLPRWRLQRARLEHVDDAEAVRSGLALLEEVRAAGRGGLAASVAALVAPRLVALGRADEGRALARSAMQQCKTLAPDDVYRGDVWWSCCSTLRADFDAELSHIAIWLQDTARDRVPAEYRDSFLNRNPSNRELLRAATRKRPPA
jgi:DNA-binding SARP family transcriptional activator